MAAHTVMSTPPPTPPPSNIQMFIFNKTDHTLTEKLLCVYQQAPACFIHSLDLFYVELCTGGTQISGGGGRGDYTYRYTVTTTMRSASRWAAMRATFTLHSLRWAKWQDSIHKPQLLKRRESWRGESNQRCSLTSLLPHRHLPGQTGSHDASSPRVPFKVDVCFFTFVAGVTYLSFLQGLSRF